MDKAHSYSIRDVLGFQGSLEWLDGPHLDADVVGASDDGHHQAAPPRAGEEAGPGGEHGWAENRTKNRKTPNRIRFNQKIFSDRNRYNGRFR
jgi:hypothetical protein